MMLKNKKGAMEMSMGTIVTIVLLMSVLVLGIFFVQKIFSSGSDAIDSIDAQVQNEIAKLFSEEGVSLAVYPTSREINLKAGDDPKGFAFSIKNKDVEPHEYQYSVSGEQGFNYGEKCGSTMTQQKADSYLILSSGTIELGPGGDLELPKLVMFDIPEIAPPCTIPYKLKIDQDGAPFQGTTVYVTIK